MSLLNKTTLAATRFTDGNGLHIRVYFQYSTANLKESFYDQTIGWNVRGDGSVISAKLNSPIAVRSWASGTQIRVYYLDPDDYVCERMYTGGSSWLDGSLRTYGFQAAPFSQLAVCGTGENDTDLRLRVYFQSADFRIQELQLNNTWSKSTHQFPLAVAGSSLASFTGMRGIPGWWLYYQDPSLNLQEILTGSGDWHSGGYNPSGTFRPGAAISAITLAGQIRVYAVNEDNELVETKYDGRSWVGTSVLTNTVTDSGVAAIQWGDSSTSLGQIRVYFQRPPTGIQEWAGDGTIWSRGANVPLYG